MKLLVIDIQKGITDSTSLCFTGYSNRKSP